MLTVTETDVAIKSTMNQEGKMKYAKKILALLTAGMLLAGCGGGNSGGSSDSSAAGEGEQSTEQNTETAAEDSGGETTGGTLKFGAQVTDTQLANLSPFAVSGGYPEWYKLVYEQLLYFNEVKGELEPALADSYEWNDEKTELTFTLN